MLCVSLVSILDVVASANDVEALTPAVLSDASTEVENLPSSMLWRPWKIIVSVSTAKVLAITVMPSGTS